MSQSLAAQYLDVIPYFLLRGELYFLQDAGNLGGSSFVYKLRGANTQALVRLGTSQGVVIDGNKVEWVKALQQNTIYFYQGIVNSAIPPVFGGFSTVYTISFNPNTYITAQKLFNVGEPFSVALWIRFLNNPNATQNIVSNTTSFGPYAFIQRLPSGQIQVTQPNTGGAMGAGPLQVISNKSILADGNWHLIVAVVKYETISIYIDGVLDNSVSYTDRQFTGATWDYFQLGDPSSGFTGYVLQVATYNGDIGSQVSAIYSAGPTSRFPTNGALFLWYMSGFNNTPLVVQDQVDGINGSVNNASVSAVTSPTTVVYVLVQDQVVPLKSITITPSNNTTTSQPITNAVTPASFLICYNNSNVSVSFGSSQNQPITVGPGANAQVLPTLPKGLRYDLSTVYFVTGSASSYTGTIVLLYV